MLASAFGAAIAAEYRMPCLLDALVVRVTNGAASFWFRAQGASPLASVSGRFAGSGVFNPCAAGWPFQRSRICPHLRPVVAAFASNSKSAAECSGACASAINGRFSAGCLSLVTLALQRSQLKSAFAG